MGRKVNVSKQFNFVDYLLRLLVLHKHLKTVGGNDIDSLVWQVYLLKVSLDALLRFFHELHFRLLVLLLKALRIVLVLLVIVTLVRHYDVMDLHVRFGPHYEARDGKALTVIEDGDVRLRESAIEEDDDGVEDI